MDNSKFVVSTVNLIDKDLRVTDNGDGTLTILILSTGNAVIYNSDGKAIGRNPGQVRFELLVDHGGTPSDPSDDTEISFEQVKGSTGRTDDFCEVVVPALKLQEARAGGSRAARPCALTSACPSRASITRSAWNRTRSGAPRAKRRP